VRQVAAAFPRARVELWATDEHRIGLKPLLRRIWAPIGQRPIGQRPIGQRPIAPVQHRYAWRYLVGFVHPASGRTLFHLATSVSSPLFEAELAAFARQAGAGPNKQIVLVLDRAGWHSSQRLRVPNHVHLLFLPPYSPELQPAEHLRPLINTPLINTPLINTPLINTPLINTPLINRHFSSIEELEELEEAQLAHCVSLQRQPERIRSTTLFHWWPHRLKKRQGPRRS